MPTCFGISFGPLHFAGSESELFRALSLLFTRCLTYDARLASNGIRMICAGMTLAFWYRHIPCLDAECEIKVLYFGWGGIYIHDHACYIEVKVEGEPQGDYWYFEKFGIPSKFRLRGDKIWRHIAFQFDEDAEMMRFYLDGTLAMEGPSLAPVSEMDLEETKLLQVAGQSDLFESFCYCWNCTCFVVRCPSMR